MDTDVIITLLTITVIILALVIVVMIVALTIVLLKLRKIMKQVNSVGNAVSTVTSYLRPDILIRSITNLIKRS